MSDMNTFKPEPVAREELDRFIYRYYPRSAGFPKRIEPVLVERVLREELAKGRPGVGPGGRMVELAAFFDTRGIVQELIKQLNRQEKSDDDIVVSAAFTRAVGFLGTETQRGVGRDYYRYLLALPQALRRMAELLQCWAVYVSPETNTATQT